MQAEAELSARREAILRALVEEYIRMGEPVPSQHLSDQLAAIHGPGYGPATVRNELAVLEEDGLILQPHVSAGRVPTDLGYRYFVERLMRESQLAPEEQRLIRHQFYQVQHQLDEWVRLTASIMAQALQSAAIISLPRSAEARLKHFELLSLNEMLVLIVVVMRDGTVRQERMLLDTPLNQDDLSLLAQRLNERFYDATALVVDRYIAHEGQRYSAQERLVVESLARLLAAVDFFAPETFHREGIGQLLRREEFAHADSERIRQVVEALERSRFLPSLAPEVMASGEGVRVMIGSETGSEALKDLSVVVSRYGGEGSLGGMLGIVGPQRMQYGRAIAIVRYMTQLLNDLLS